MSTVWMEDSGRRSVEPPRVPFQLLLEHLLAPGKNVIQRILEVRRRLGELFADLLDVFLVALLDLLAEELFQRAPAHALITLLRMIGHHVGDQRASQPLRLLIWIIGEEWIDRRL